MARPRKNIIGRVVLQINLFSGMLTLFLGAALQPADAQDRLGKVWYESEREWQGVWRRIGEKNQFNAEWGGAGNRVAAILTITLDGNRVVVVRRDTVGPYVGKTCRYKGILEEDEVSGTYKCDWDTASHEWSARIAPYEDCPDPIQVFKSRPRQWASQNARVYPDAKISNIGSSYHDGKTYLIASPFRRKIEIPNHCEVIVSADAKGSQAVSVDNFLLLDIKGLSSAAKDVTLVAGGTYLIKSERIIYKNRDLEKVYAGPLNLTSRLFASGADPSEISRFEFKLIPLDEGGVLELSNVFLVFRAGERPPEKGLKVKIGSVHVDHRAWEARRQAILIDLAKARRELASAENDLAQAQNMRDSASRKFKAWRKRLDDLSRQLKNAQRSAIQIPDQVKTPEYRAAERRLASRLEQLDRHHALLGSLQEIPFEKRTENQQKEIDFHISMIDRLDRRKNQYAKEFIVLKERLYGDRVRRSAERVRSLSSDLHQLRKQGIRDLVEYEFQEADRLYRYREAEYFKKAAHVSDLEQKYIAVGGPDAPFPKKISSRHFEAAQIRNADEFANSLRDIRAAIRKAESELLRRDQVRVEARNEFVRAVGETNRAADALAAAFYKSALAQMYVEYVVFVYDVGSATLKGPAALAVELVDKTISAATGTTWYDGTWQEDKDRGKTFDLGDPGYHQNLLAGRGIKSFSKVPVKLAAEHLVANGKIESLYENFLKDTILEKSPAASVVGSLRDRFEAVFDEQEKIINNSKENLSKLRTKSGFLKELGKSFVKGLAKDYFKDVAKREAAKFFENDAGQAYLASIEKHRSARLIYIRASNMYWTTKDAHTFLVRLHSEIQNTFDLDEGVRVSRSDFFEPRSGYEVELVFDESVPLAERDIRVRLGPVTLTRLGRTLTFELPDGVDEVLKDHDGQALPLDIVIAR